MTDINRNRERVMATGEVFTDSYIVENILDMVNPEDWANPSITMLEPSCGDGNFVIAIITRFMKGLENVIPDEEERFKNIIENQVYAIDIMLDNVLATRKRISETFGYDIYKYDNKIVHADSLAYDWSFGKEITDDFFTYKSEIPKDDYSQKMDVKLSAPRKSVDKSKVKTEDFDVLEFGE